MIKLILLLSLILAPEAPTQESFAFSKKPNDSSVSYLEKLKIKDASRQLNEKERRALCRLLVRSYSAQPSESYTYDQVGNRMASQQSASYSYQPFNQLTNTDTATYTYDNNGNLLSKTDDLGTTTYS